MLDFLLYYNSVGFILSLILNITLWAIHRPCLSAIETLACTLLWPTTIVTLINTIKGEQEDIED